MDKYQDLINHIFINPGKRIVNSSRYWARVISCRAEVLKNKQEVFCAVNEHWDHDTIEAFGTARPLAGQYLLHLAPGWDSNIHKTPVILIHGAGLDATSFTNLYGMGYDGIQQQLAALGHRVFALTFSHSHGDNFYQAEQLADAISRVRDLCKVEKVDLIAHSKGGIAARLYLSNMSLTAYRDDVRKYVMLGTPNLGTDFAFRNPALSYPLYLSDSNGVIAWDKISLMGEIADTSLRSVYADGSFPGQSQILYRWDDQYPLDITQADWWTTYYGGWGFLSHSRGIDDAIEDGGNLIVRLESKGIEPGVELYVLAGDSHMFGFIPGENTAPSDGIVFIDSVLNTDAMTSGGARLIAKKILNVNHLELLFSREVARWVDQQLRD